MGDFLAMFITLYLSGCLVARIWIDIITQDRDIKQVWLSWFYVIETIITWNWKNKQKRKRLGNLSNKDFAILYNYENSNLNSEFEFIAKNYIQNYGNRLKDAYIYAKYENSEKLISLTSDRLNAIEDPNNILEIFKALWLSNKYSNSINIYLNNNCFSVDELKNTVNSSLDNIQFSKDKLYTGTNKDIELCLTSEKIKGKSILISVDNLNITYKII